MTGADGPLHDAERQMAEHELSVFSTAFLKVSQATEVRAILARLDLDMSPAEERTVATELERAVEQVLREDPGLRELAERLQALRPPSEEDDS